MRLRAEELAKKRPPDRLSIFLAMSLLTGVTGLAPAAVSTRSAAWSELVARPLPPSGLRVTYGGEALQFGELRLPERPGPHPVAVVIHGGCWRAAFDLRHITHLSAALTESGWATWTIEYRRLGDAGGGWPGTFTDVGHAIDALRGLAAKHSLDLSRVATIGHSAGGHLALWALLRSAVPAASPLAMRDPLPLAGAVGLAPITDLARYSAGASDCSHAALELLGGERENEVGRARQREGSPSALAAGGSGGRPRVRLIHGAADGIVPLEQSERFAALFAEGDRGDVRLVALDGLDHFDPIAPWSTAWPAIEKALREVSGGAPAAGTGSDPQSKQTSK